MLRYFFRRFEEPEIEEAYQRHMADRAALIIYWVMVFGTVSMLLFTLIDMNRDGAILPWIVRASLLIPMIIIALWVRRAPVHFSAYYQRIMLVLAVTAAVTTLMSFEQASDQVAHLQKGSLTLTLFGILTLFRLPFGRAIGVCIMSVVGFVVIMIRRGDAENWSGHDLSLLLMTVMIGGLVNWLLESEARDAFSLTFSLKRKVQETKATRNELTAEIREHRETLEDLLAARREAERASEAKSDFVAAVSHELRTPMNGMFGALALLENTQLGDEQKQYTSVLTSSAQNLSLLLDDLFDLTRIEAGLMRIEPVPTDLYRLLEDLQKAHGDQAHDQGLDLRLETQQETLPRWVILDPNRIRQVLSNLVHNALKFTREGSVIVRVDALENNLNLYVLDTGCGLPEDPLTVFTKYHQESTNHGGLGLGLSICKMLIEHMGGQISAHHRDGGGSEFRVAIPLLLASKPSTEKVLSSLVPTYRTGATVLLVEDNPINLKVARWNLEQMGCKVLVASDGSRALEQLSLDEVDLVLMDCEMPSMDGFETTRAFRRSEDAMSRLPIVALTAHATRGARERCLDAGMDDYLAKPFRRNDLERLLERWLPT